MKMSVMGSSQVKVLKSNENLRVLGGFYELKNTISMGLISKTGVHFNPSKVLRNNTNNRFGFTIRAVHSPDIVPVAENVSGSTFKTADDIRLYVGLPLDVVSERNTVNHQRAITAGLKALKLMGIDGIELPVWWGLVEKDAMGKYDWSGYLAIAELVQKLDLKLHVSLCFHASQQPKISLPKWVSQVGEADPDVYFTDSSGRRYKDCLSFAVDEVPILDGKSPVEVYRDFSESFKSVFAPFMGTTIMGISIGLGPDGELGYPSCHQSANPTTHSGVGEFQCYDKYMLSNLKQHGEATGNPLWGLGGPHDVPAYNEPPSVNTFFKDDGGSWETLYGDFFLAWYSSQLLSHGGRLLSLASTIFSDVPVTLSGKLPLMHSWYKTRSHSSELTAGFYNTANRDGYREVVEMFARNSCRIILPGMDLLDEHQPDGSSPRSLLAQIKESCRVHGVGVSGQNLSVSGASEGFEEINRNLSDDNAAVDLFIYQRMGADFFSPKHFPTFTTFVRTLNQLDLNMDDLPDEKDSAHVCSGAGINLQMQLA